MIPNRVTKCLSSTPMFLERSRTFDQFVRT